MINSVNCPVCENLCFSEAFSCPKCGHPLTRERQRDNPVLIYLKKASQFFQNQSASARKWIIFSGIAGIVAVIVVSIAISNIGKIFGTNQKSERDLCEAAINGDAAKLKKLIESGVNVNTTIYKSGNPLTLAILYATPSTIEEPPSETKRLLRLQMVRLLLDNGANVNQGDNSRSPLAIARIADDDKDLEELLLKAGANPDTEKAEGTARGLPKKINASLLKVLYSFEASQAANKEAEKEKRNIIDGKN